MKVKKEVARTGRHVYIDHDGRPAILDATPADIDRWHKDGLAMVAAGLPIPVPLEHDPKAHPLNADDLKADRVRNNAGFVETYEKDIIKDVDTGEDVHRVLSVLDIKDAKIGEQIAREAIPFVSPWFNTFTDGTGRKWDNVISHVALTTTPVIARQEKFISMPAMLSIAAPRAKLPDQGVYLSAAGRLKKNGKPKYPIAFSLMAGVKLSKDEIKEIEKESKGEGNGKEGECEGEGGDEGEARRMPLDQPETEAKDLSIHETIGHLLKACGFTPPDGMSEETFERDIYETLMAKVQELTAANKTPADADPAKPPEQKGKPPGPVQTEQPPMYMSLTMDEVAKIADPKERQTAEAFLSLRQENEKNRAIAASATKHILDEAVKLRDQRIDRICKFYPASEREVLLSLKAKPDAALSLNASGGIVDPIDAILRGYEAGVKHLPAFKDSVKLSEQPQPKDEGGPMTEERAEQLAEDLAGRGMNGMNGVQKKPAA